MAASLALTGKIVDVADYRDICEYPDMGDFVYLDPPYDPLSATSSFTGYTKGSFGEEDQKALAEVFRKLDKRGCKVLLSNSATELIKTLYHMYNIRIVRATRAINSKPSGRKPIDEFLITNY